MALQNSSQQSNAQNELGRLVSGGDGLPSFQLASPPVATRNGLTMPANRIYLLDDSKKYVPRKISPADHPDWTVVPCSDGASQPPMTSPLRQPPLAAAAGDAGGPGLSNSHIQSLSFYSQCGQIEIWKGAHAVCIRCPSENCVPHPQKRRGKIKEFSRKSRQRMMAVMNKIRMNDPASFPLFVTCTFPDGVPEPDEVSRIWEVFCKKVERRFPNAAMVWRKELKTRKSGEQSKGVCVPHFHVLLWNVSRVIDYAEENGKWTTLKLLPEEVWEMTIYRKDEQGNKVVAQDGEIAQGGQDRLGEWWSRAWYEAVGSGDYRNYQAGTRVEVIRKFNGVRCYVSKYIAKVDREEVARSPYCKGRWWGIKRRNLIPWGERVMLPCTSKQATMLMRIARRYVRSVTGHKYHFSHISMNVYVNESEQWLRLFKTYIKESDKYS